MMLKDKVAVIYGAAGAKSTLSTSRPWTGIYSP
jgi:hypothetical protein